MARSSPNRNAPRRRRRIAAIALSAAVHALVFVALDVQFGSPVVIEAAPPIEVGLVRQPAWVRAAATAPAQPHPSSPASAPNPSTASTTATPRASAQAQPGELRDPNELRDNVFTVPFDQRDSAGRLVRAPVDCLRRSRATLTERERQGCAAAGSPSPAERVETARSVDPAIQSALQQAQRCAKIMGAGARETASGYASEPDLDCH